MPKQCHHCYWFSYSPNYGVSLGKMSFKMVYSRSIGPLLCLGIHPARCWEVRWNLHDWSCVIIFFIIASPTRCCTCFGSCHSSNHRTTNIYKLVKVSDSSCSKTSQIAPCIAQLLKLATTWDAHDNSWLFFFDTVEPIICRIRVVSWGIRVG